LVNIKNMFKLSGVSISTRIE